MFCRVREKCPGRHNASWRVQILIARLLRSRRQTVQQLQHPGQAWLLQSQVSAPSTSRIQIQLHVGGSKAIQGDPSVILYKVRVTWTRWFWFSVLEEDIPLQTDGLWICHLANALSFLQTSECLQKLSIQKGGVWFYHYHDQEASYLPKKLLRKPKLSLPGMIQLFLSLWRPFS